MTLFLTHIMLGIILIFKSKMDMSEIYILMHYDFKIGNNTVAATRNINDVYGADAVNEHTVHNAGFRGFVLENI